MTILLNKRFLKELITFIVVFVVVNLLETKDVWAASQIIAKVRDRAAIVIEHYKPVVYILGGFGLVCVAWGAIFGKMNWKWFANLAIGLFLVAWMGHLIDYFTKNRASSTASAKFASTSNLVKFGDTIGKKSLADGGKFSSLQIKGEDGEKGKDGKNIEGYNDWLGRYSSSVAYLESDWVETAIKRSGESLYAANAASTLVSGSEYTINGVDVKKILQTGSDWEEASKNAKDEYKSLVAARAGSALVSGSIKTKIVNASGETVDDEYLAQGNVSSDWSDTNLAYTASNLERGSFNVVEEDGSTHTYLAGGNAITNFRSGVMSNGSGSAGFGDAKTNFEFSGDFGNSDYAQMEIAGLAGMMMFDEETDMRGLNEETRMRRLNESSHWGPSGNVGSDWEDTNVAYTASNLTEGKLSYTDASGEHTDNADGDVHTILGPSNETYGYGGDTGSDWEETDVAYTASKLVNGTLTYTDASGEHTDNADGDVKTTLAGPNDNYGYQGDVDTNMDSADGYQNVNSNMNSASGYKNVNSNMNSAAGYKDVNTNMNSAAGYQDVNSNLNSSRGYADEETHWGR